MTGRTHDLAAFTALTYLVATQPLQEITLSTAMVAFGANMLGGLAPDIDQSTASFWGKIRGGNIISKLISPLLGGHRFISHSILGIFLFGFILQILLDAASSVLLVNMDIVWWAFMIGFVSHLLMDTFTREGVPWFFPIPIRFGIPPLRFLRIKTGGKIEKYFIFPGLVFINFYLIYLNYQKFLDFFKQYLR
ncbi:metal-dependent hydrolase [Candidatus Daviesbacteria bacterium]|nr:metal-dependent hydrolase [Candidatus Daviesbacteria bacterium]